MALELAGLLVVNGAYLVVGVAVLLTMRWVSAEPRTWRRLGVAYLLGVAVVTVPASYLALAGVPVSWTATVVGFVVVVLAAWRADLRRPDVRPAWPALSAGGLAAAGIGVALVVLLLYASRTFAIRPLVDWDSWAVWTAKARLLYADPSLAPAALRSGNYGPTPYPIGLPTLEALGFSAMSRYDGTLIGVQFLLLALGFPAALWSLLRLRARSWTIVLVALAIVSAPQMLFQLLTHYADVPLGLFVGLGLAAGAAWLVSGPSEGWLLGCFAVFLGMAGLTKSEGFLFALAGAVALGVAALAKRERSRLVPAALGIGALLAVIMPWRIYCLVYGLSTPDYNLSHITDVSYLRAHADRVHPVVRELWRQSTALNKWGFLLWVIVLALVAGVLAASWRLLAFALVWLFLAAGGLVLTYWVLTLPVQSNLTNSSYRTIVSLLIGGASLVPLFVFPRPADEAERASL